MVAGDRQATPSGKFTLVGETLFVEVQERPDDVRRSSGDRCLDVVEFSCRGHLSSIGARANDKQRWHVATAVVCSTLWSS